MKKVWFIFTSILLIFKIIAAQFTEDQQYTRLKTPIINSNEPQVLEFFSFYCPHCYQFEHIYHMSNIMRKALPIGTKIIKYHVDFLGPMGKYLTQAWAVAMVLNIEDKISSLLFDGIQKTKTIKTLENIRSVFITAGVDAKEYDSIWNSFIVKNLTIQQSKAATDLKLYSVPTIFINGKYMVKNDGLDMSSIENYTQQFIDVINFLLEQK